MSQLTCCVALKEGDHSVLQDTIRNIRLELVNDLRLTSVESTKNIYPALSKLHFFQEIESTYGLRYVFVPT
jgi:hypothetical protein